KLRGRPIANSHRARTSISLEVVEGLFRQVAVTVNRKHRRQGLSDMSIERRVVVYPVHETGRFVFKADSEKRVNCESRVPDPSISVIPIAPAPNCLGEACGRGSDYCAGRLECEQLQS